MSPEPSPASSRFLPVLVILAGLTLSPANAQEGETLASKQLQQDTFANLSMTDGIYGPDCRQPRRVLKTEITEKPTGVRTQRGRMMAGKWAERWTIDRCGKPVVYTVTYTADGRGGTFIGTEIEGKPDLPPMPTGPDFELLGAAEEGKTARLTELLDQGANIEALAFGGQTPLFRAAWNGHAAAVGILLARGANVRATNKSGASALHFTANAEVARMLIAAGADLECQDLDHNQVPLHYAVARAMDDVAQVLLEAGAKVDPLDKYGNTPLMQAAARPGIGPVIRVLLQKGANVRLINPKTGGTPLHYASFFGHADCTRLLLESGADINAFDNKGDTPLILAARMGQTKMVQFLLAAGANPAIKNAAGADAEKEAANREIKNLLKDAKEKRRS